MAVCGAAVPRLTPDNRSLATVRLEGIDVTFGLLPSRAPAFDAVAAGHARDVLVRVKGFSCNYRDLNMIFAALRRGPDNSFFALGSDFVGEVVAVGAGVTRFKPGDRVIADNHYDGTGQGRVPQGVLTNQASREFLVAAEEKLVAVPDAIPDEVAAAFSIGAQTAYSMLRKLELRPGAKVLVTAAKSNTALFAINALRAHDVRVYALSTSRRFERELRELGVCELIEVDGRAADWAADARALRALARIGLFEYVVDPFFDLYLHKAVEVMAPNGRYVTCGLHEQFQPALGQPPAAPRAALTPVLLTALTRNLTLLGNCIGHTTDLRRALEDCARGTLAVRLDSVFRGDHVGAFFARTFADHDRFGKVVYLYD